MPCLLESWPGFAAAALHPEKAVMAAGLVHNPRSFPQNPLYEKHDHRLPAGCQSRTGRLQLASEKSARANASPTGRRATSIAGNIRGGRKGCAGGKEIEGIAGDAGENLPIRHRTIEAGRTVAAVPGRC